ncbi:MAG: response regulator [Burkholderiales bacterium]|nr:response regulator [Burkholderiales bacterium]
MIKVVVIDGNAISRNLLTTLLMNGGYEVVGDSNASTAGIASMIKLLPQIVCIDIGEANEEGLGRLDTVLNALPKSMVFMVSGNFEANTIETYAKRGVHGFIVKPFKVVTVLNTIRNAILKIARKHKAGSPSASEDGGTGESSGT